MTPVELRAAIDALAAVDETVARAVESRRAGDVSQDRVIAAALAPAKRPRSYLITMRGLRRVLGARGGRVFVQALREAAALSSTLPEAHPAYDALWWLAELLPDLKAGGDGVDIGDAETRAALRDLAVLGPALGTPHVVTAAHCDALDAASTDLVPITPGEVSTALSEGA